MFMKDIMGKFACLLLVVFAIFLPTIDCQPAEWSKVHLKHVDRSDRKAPGGKMTVDDYAAAAIMMHEDIYPGDLQTRCSAYAHLFKLMDISRGRLNKAGMSMITPELVFALNKVAYADRDEYKRLFAKYRGERLGDIFRAAIEELERKKDSHQFTATWLELIECASHNEDLMKLDAFFAMKIRANRIKEAREQTNMASTKKVPSNSVSNADRPIFYTDLVAARALVEKFDDDDLKLKRKEIRREKLDEKEIRKYLDALYTIYPKIQSRIDYGRGAKLKIEDVENWINYSDELSKDRDYLVSISHPLLHSQIGREVEIFLSDPYFQYYTKRVRPVLSAYGRAKREITRIKSIDAHKSFEELTREYEPLIKLYEEIDTMVDDEEITREAKKYREFQVMNSFIGESDKK